MLRWVLLAVIVVGISGLATWLILSSSSGDGSFDNRFPDSGAAGTAGGLLPKLVIDGPLVHEFGLMAQAKKGQHNWVIKNDGPGTLILQGGEPSCSCTVLNLKKGMQITLKEGESYKLNVEWETRSNNGAYEKTASIYSNDPEHPELTFHIKGRVKPSMQYMPSDRVLDLGSLVNTEPHDFTCAVASPDRPDTKITSITTTRPELISVRDVPLTEEEATRLDSTAGHKLVVTIQPTTNLGAFNEEIVLKTDNPDVPEVRFTVAGKVVGPISFMPPVVHLSAARASKETSAVLSIWAQGEAKTEFTLADVPPQLKVTITPLDEKGENKEVKGHAYRMEVAIRPDAQPGVVDKPIALKTTHPLAKEVQVPVDIQIVGDE